MLDWIRHYLDSALAATRAVDAIDVAVIAVLVYVVLLWLSKARSRVLIGGVAVLAVLYVLAELLELHLTIALFRGLIAAAAVVTVVIFQDEIRRSLEGLAAALSPGRARSTGPNEDVEEVLVAALTKLAQARIGALVVLAGREPLTRHLAAGVPLHARLSEPLLHSLFDPHSAGHDGAVIVQRNRATQFGAHLPLSLNVTGAEGFGTRHAAALGLSERCDALVLVVSEERGTLSVAEGGRLAKLSGAEALRREIQRFRKRLVTPSRRHWVSRWVTRRLGLKLSSVLVALALWLVAFGYRRDTATRTVNAPVVLENLPEGWVIRTFRPTEVSVALSGPARVVEQLLPTDVSISLNAASWELASGTREVTVTVADVNVPDELEVLSVRPSSLRLGVERIVEMSLPVQPATIGKPPEGYVVSAMSVDPPSVAVRISEQQQRRIRQLRTHVIDLSELRHGTSLKRELVLPGSIELLPGETTGVTVYVAIVPDPGRPDAGGVEEDRPEL